MWRKREVGGCAISIETQAYCGGTCPECPRNLDPTRSRWRDGTPIRDQMPTDMVYRLIDEAVEMDWRGPVHFSHYSEPLEDPRFIDFCKYARSRGLIPELYTNGVRLTPEYARKIDGLVPRVVMSFRTLGTHSYWQSMFKRSTVSLTGEYHVLIWSPNRELLHKAIEKVRDKPCIGPLFTAFRVNYDGQMSMCYADFNNEFGLLNAYDHSLEELWFGEEHIRVVREMSKPGSRQNRALCRECPEVYPDGGYYVPVKKGKHPNEL